VPYSEYPGTALAGVAMSSEESQSEKFPSMMMGLVEVATGLVS
jgi:hypothetical protein